jgi:hypothetical protein
MRFAPFTLKSIGKPIDYRIDMRSGCNVVAAAPLVVSMI